MAHFYLRVAIISLLIIWITESAYAAKPEQWTFLLNSILLIK